MSLSEQQRGVLKGIVAAAAVTAVALAGVVWWRPDFLVPGEAISARLGFVLRTDLAIAAVLAFTIGSLARHRFFTPADIDGARDHGGMVAGTPRAKVLESILQNTLEQAVLAVLVHLIWAATMPAAWLPAIAAAATLFLVGRILFWRGYDRGAAARALGFGLTFYPTVLMLVILLLFVALSM